MKFKVGDVVQLESGGPRMTVIQIKEDKLRCRWYSQKDEKYFTRLFEVDSLEYPSRPVVGGDRGLRGL